MHVSRTNKDVNTAVLTITAAEPDLEPIRRHVLSHFVHEVKIPGFRAGKAPLELVEKHVDQQRFMNEFMEHAVNELYNRAFIQEKLRVVAQPQIEVKKFVPFTTLEFEATVLFVQITKLADYKKNKVSKQPVSVTAKDVDDVLKSLAQRAADKNSVNRPAKLDDEVIIDFSGIDDKGQKVSGADGRDLPLILGSKTFIPGFEDHLVGQKSGDTKVFTIPFPKDYGVAALQGKKVTFTVSVKAVNETISPKLDDSFAAKVSPFKKLTELKADIKKQLRTERQTQANRELESQIIAQLAEKSELKVPAQLIEEQVIRMEEDEKQNLVSRGQTWEEHLKAEGIDEKQHRDRHRPDAERNIKAGILLGEIAEAEAVDVTPEELAIRTQILKGQITDSADQAKLDEQEAQRDIRARMLTEKTLAKLTDYATK